MSKEKTIIWSRSRTTGAGHEFVRVFSKNSKHFLEGAAIFVSEKKFCKLDYQIVCDNDWKTLSAKISGFIGDEKIKVEIETGSNGIWKMNGEEISAVRDCIDIDLNFSPSTNLLPIRRLNLQIGESAKVCAARLKFPSFKLETLEQTYRRISENKYAYESDGGTFRTKLETDEFGIVVSYPNFWQIENI